MAGWDEGCLTMAQGEVAQLTIAGHKGYGAQGFPAWGYPFCQSFMFAYVRLFMCESNCECVIAEQPDRDSCCLCVSLTSDYNHSEC